MAIVECPECSFRGRGRGWVISKIGRSGKPCPRCHGMGKVEDATGATAEPQERRTPPDPTRATPEDETRLGGLCGRCGKRPGKSPHSCPYQLDVNNDQDTLCDCCDDCAYECAMDI